jgi:hypothetical protein
MKFKKHISILLTILILVSNVGFAFNVHYCGGSISSVSLTSVVPEIQKEKSCCVEKALKKESCCKDKKVVFQKKTIDKIFKSFSFQFDSALLVSEYQTIDFKSVPRFKNEVSLSYYCDANAPPLFKLYNQYLLYDSL